MIELCVATHLVYTTLSLLVLGSIDDGLRGPMTWAERYGCNTYIFLYNKYMLKRVKRVKQVVFKFK
jgi:hypothetical protein